MVVGITDGFVFILVKWLLYFAAIFALVTASIVSCYGCLVSEVSPVSIPFISHVYIVR
jgi:hypothetical protein